MATRRRVHLYRDRKGEWRWTLFAANGRKLANAGEGYTKRQHCSRMARSLFPTAVMSAVGYPEA